MREMGTDNVLVTIPISHYCEKARWALDRTDVTYRESAHVQALHRIATRRAGGGLTAPVLVCADGVLADSADILSWADGQSRPGRALYPNDPVRATEVRRIEDDFNTRLGPHSRCWLYQQLRRRRDLAISYGCTGIPTWERATLRLGYPVLIAIVARVLDVTPSTAVQSEREVRAVFDEVGERLADGRRYLCGDEFTAADLTFSALAAPVLMPAAYGVTLPQPDELPAYAAEVVHELRAHPAGAHALTMFDTERH
ncbi:MAG: glutathione S-transferase family protein [Solirubrobacteraceae bacterium]